MIFNERVYLLCRCSLSHSRKMFAISVLVKICGQKVLTCFGSLGMYDWNPIICKYAEKPLNMLILPYLLHEDSIGSGLPNSSANSLLMPFPDSPRSVASLSNRLSLSSTSSILYPRERLYFTYSYILLENTPLLRGLSSCFIGYCRKK